LLTALGQYASLRLEKGGVRSEAESSQTNPSTQNAGQVLRERHLVLREPWSDPAVHFLLKLGCRAVGNSGCVGYSLWRGLMGQRRLILDMFCYADVARRIVHYSSVARRFHNCCAIARRGSQPTGVPTGMPLNNNLTDLNNTISGHHSRYPDVTSMRVKHNTNVKIIPWYPDVAPMRVKRNTNVEIIPSLGITCGTLMSPQCV
jgi:hypothetical protein